MHPTLLTIGSFKIHSYGVFIAIGFLSTLYWVGRNAKAEDRPVQQILDLSFWTFVIGLFGGRVTHVITQWETFADSPERLFSMWEGGFVIYGAVTTGLIFSTLWMKWKKWDILGIYDIWVAPLIIGQAWGRLGCFLAGCCHGIATDLPWGVAFNSPLVEPHLRGMPVHPTQLYSSFINFALAAVLHWRWKNRKYKGQVMIWYAFLYAITRSIVETVRGDDVREFVMDNMLSTSQFIALVWMTVFAIIWWKIKPKKTA